MIPTTSESEFWRAMERLIADSEIVIERARGTRHPEHPQIVYPLDYGCLKGTSSSDGEEIDLFLGTDPARRLTGAFVTVDLEKRDCEIKLLIGCTGDEIRTVDHFFNDYASMKGLLLLRKEET